MSSEEVSTDEHLDKDEVIKLLRQELGEMSKQAIETGKAHQAQITAMTQQVQGQQGAIMQLDASCKGMKKILEIAGMHIARMSGEAL